MSTLITAIQERLATSGVNLCQISVSGGSNIVEVATIPVNSNAEIIVRVNLSSVPTIFLLVGYNSAFVDGPNSIYLSLQLVKTPIQLEHLVSTIVQLSTMVFTDYP